jgi:superfamily I DNA/RNA helicase
LFDKTIKGLLLVNSQSTRYIPETRTEKHYFTDNYKIYSDKLSTFVFRCNEKSNGEVISRLSRIYTHIFIDEVQDLAGYDLELLKLIFKSRIITLMVGDPRQGTYSTNSSLKNKKFRKSEIVHFFEEIPGNIEIDRVSLTTNYRCNSTICNLSNKLFPDLQEAKSGNTIKTEHDGVFFIRKQDVESYLKKYQPIQLRDSIKVEINKKYKAMNFGESKGLSFERVLIYPTKPFIDWLIDNRSELAPTSRSKFYVALTRASQSVGIIYDYDEQTCVEGIHNFNMNE